MNRKQIQEQNDISRIIGNLPKRLQKKITEDVGSDQLHLNSIQHEEEKRENSVDSTLDCQTSIDYFLRGNSACVLETSVRSAKTAPKHIGNDANVEDDEMASVPGIIRLKVNNTSTTSQQNYKPLKKEERQTKKLEANVFNKSVPVPVWFSQLAEVPYTRGMGQLFDSFTTMMQSDEAILQWKRFCETRQELQSIFSQLLLHKLKFCCEQKVDNFFWKQLFYSVREYLKSKSASIKTDEHITMLLQSGLEFYNDLHDKLSAKYLQHETDETSRQASKYVFIAKVAAQKLLIYMGDLCRYQTKQLQSDDYTKAVQYYYKAQALIPSNGIPYNQLAIIAIYAHKKFDITYFHMRALMSSNAIFSARESLLVLFDEIRKKYEETEMKSSPKHRHNSPIHVGGVKSMRKEVWIYPDGVRCLHRTDITGNKSTLNEENNLSELPLDELLKRFTSLYLYMIGKLYTGIGMESIQHHQRKLVILLNVLMKQQSLPFKQSRILKMAALNIFVLDHNMKKDSRREIRYHAFKFCNEIFGLFLRKANQLLNDLYKQIENIFSSESYLGVTSVLQFVKIYLDWLKHHVDIWEPLRSEEHAFVDCWSELKRLFVNIENLNKAESIKGMQERNVSLIVLDEDKFLLGFTPLSSLLPTQHKNEIEPSEMKYQFLKRIFEIANFNKCFQENKYRLERLEDSSFIYEDLNVDMKTALQQLQINSEHEDDNSENIEVNGLNQNRINEDLKLGNSNSSENFQISHLCKLKKELEAKSNVKKMYNAKLEEMLKLVDSNIYIEVRPKYLMPDTNCFIDCLEDFERLSQEFKHYNLIIPLTVVKELDGLSKGVKLESLDRSLQKHRIHHFDDVSSRAKKSLDFIKTAKNGVKCATTKGSIINASLFALVEEEHVSNDDKILATALALTKTMSSETSKDGKCFIQTELVLITTDRNLRVKALSRNLAVSELSEFLQWANDSHD